MPMWTPLMPMWAWLASLLARAAERARCFWVLLAATWRVAVLQRYLCSQAFWIYKVVAINEASGSDANVTKTFVPGAWESTIRLVTGWKDAPLRLDVRYLAYGRKYRLILRPGDACTFPEFPERHRGGPKGVMAAELVGEAGVAVDITRRVLKYQGPAKDFHRGMGARVGVTDMFPFDDTEELLHNFSELRIIDAHARVVRVPIGCDDLAAALGGDHQKRE